MIELCLDIDISFSIREKLVGPLDLQMSVSFTTGSVPE